MGPYERRSAILDLLCRSCHETASTLAAQFGVSERTIRNDPEALACTYPIETVRGRYGGVRVARWFRRENHTLSFRQEELLRRLRETLTGEDVQTMNSILAQFALHWEYR